MGIEPYCKSVPHGKSQGRAKQLASWQLGYKGRDRKVPGFIYPSESPLSNWTSLTGYQLKVLTLLKST